MTPGIEAPIDPPAYDARPGLDAAHGLILDTHTFDIADRCRDCGILYDDVTEECEQVRQ